MLKDDYNRMNLRAFESDFLCIIATFKGEALMENFILIFACLAFGYALSKREVFASNAPIVLNQFIIYISLPAMVLLQIPRLNFSAELFAPIVVAWIVMIVSAAFVLLFSRLLRFSREVTGSLMLVGVLGNTSFVGIPIVQAYLGDAALPYVLIYDQLGSFVALSSYATVVSIYYTSHSTVNAKAILKKIATFPPFLVLLLSLALIGVEFHASINATLSKLANTIIPLALVSVGLSLRLKLNREDFTPFFTALGIKIVIAPLVAFVVVLAFGWDGLAADVSILEAAMGPMITAGALAVMAGLAPRLSAAIVGYGTLIAFGSTWVVFRIIS